MTRSTWGAASFHFGVSKSHTSSFTGREYVAEVKRVLAEISSISNVEVLDNPSFLDSSFIPNEKEELGKETFCFPNSFHCTPPTVLVIGFDIYIPHEKQEQIIKSNLGDGFLPCNTFTEKFHVITRYAGGVPVTFIELVSPTGQHPYTAYAGVVIARFLKKELEGIPTYVTFDNTRGVFAGNFVLEEVEGNVGDTPSLMLEAEDDTLFKTTRIKYTSPIKVEPILIAISSELTLYFLIRSIEDKKSILWADIERLSDTVIRIYQTDFLRNPYRHLFDYTRNCRQAFIALTKFRNFEIESSNRISNEYEIIYADEKFRYIKKMVDRRQAHQKKYPLDSMSTLITSLEDQWTKSFQSTITAIASVLGGILGGMITVLWSK